MRYFLLVFLFLSTVGDGLKKASRINEGVAQAEKLYRQQAYEQAIDQYRFLRDSLNVKDNALLLNLAHATYQTGDLEQAQKYYSRLRNNPDPDLQGAALNQLGLIAFEDGNAEKALYYFRNAIINNPQNETARYNYELVKKYQANHPEGLPKRASGQKGPAENQKAPEPKTRNGVSESEAGQTDFISDLENKGNEPTQNKPQNGGTTANQKKNQPGNAPENQSVTAGDTPKAKGNQPGETEGLRDEDITVQPGTFGNTGGSEEITEKERQIQTLRSRLRNTDLSPEKAMLLLEAMQNAELQYLQQIPRPPSHSRNKNKPDW
jgi:tetratricopeptide (TPR) repeat protein